MYNNREGQETVTKNEKSQGTRPDGLKSDLFKIIANNEKMCCTAHWLLQQNNSNGRRLWELNEHQYNSDTKETKINSISSKKNTSF